MDTAIHVDRCFLDRQFHEKNDYCVKKACKCAQTIYGEKKKNIYIYIYKYFS